ncbi:rCG47985, partial [Rattus norvegicus]
MINAPSAWVSCLSASISTLGAMQQAPPWDRSVAGPWASRQHPALSTWLVPP